MGEENLNEIGEKKMDLPKIVNREVLRVAQEGTNNMVADASNSATRGVYSIYGDNPPDGTVDYQRIYPKR